MARQLFCRDTAKRVIHRMGPQAGADKICQNRRENIGESKFKSLVAADCRDSLSFEKRELGSPAIDLSMKDMLDVGISVAETTLVAPKELPPVQPHAQFLADLAHQSLFRRFSCFDMSAEKIPTVGKGNLRFVIAEIDQQP